MRIHDPDVEAIERAFAIRGQTCALCPSPATEAHHHVYRRGRQLITDIIPLCSPHHALISLFDKDRPAFRSYLLEKRKRLDEMHVTLQEIEDFEREQIERLLAGAEDRIGACLFALHSRPYLRQSERRAA